jgi:ABC-type uncharacterized transport system involved in gliding motility auxiliary subunit
MTGSGAWLETGELERSVRFDVGKDRRGPVTVAAVSEAEKDESGRDGKSRSGGKKGKDKINDKDKQHGGRLIVVGDSDFISNRYAGFSGNADLFLNMVKWMLEEEKVINIEPKRPKTSTFFMTGFARKVWLVGAVVLLPLLVFVSGFVVWRVRKSR